MGPIGTAPLDRFMPTYDRRSRHAIRVRAPAARTFQELRRTDLVGSATVRFLFALRTLPSRIGRPRRPLRTRTLEDLDRGGALLDEVPGHELLYGLIGRFWALRTSARRPIVRETFRSFAEPGFAKSVLSFRVTPIDPTTSLLSTETRVECTDAASRRRFAIYWAFIGPFSGLTRRVWLRAVRDAAQAQC